ncbi:MULTISPECIES: mobilization protein [unclassified Coleofasciculus]|uniref:mobilization protein n=1 Tax=unclassified Coleofasciculus TaxID=2692782 RepID=UPI00188135EC|nr:MULTISPECIES: mobilization protein [unclassified Coleofasciculus]MBE9124767.1 mobilization protein [Coleofasciculus sp. LEGE 07081]MBE9148219.1 mobilization protein [Coleofasciculus sp. LEGE 07092]
MGTIHLCDSEKGGAGKSLWCRVLCQYFIDEGKEFKLVECDRSNADVIAHYNDIDAEFAVFSEDRRRYAEGDTLFNAATSKDVIVNLPAQVRIPFDNWLEQGDILSIALDVDIQFVKWFLVTGGVDSIELFKDSFRKWGKQIPHVMVKNLYMANSDEWQGILEDDQELREIHSKIPSVLFPRFPFGERNKVDRLRMRFDEALSSAEFPLISQSRIKRFLNGCYGEIEKSKIFKEDKKGTSASASSSPSQKNEKEQEPEEVTAG